jgi:hypothetical protein
VQAIPAAADEGAGGAASGASGVESYFITADTQAAPNCAALADTTRTVMVTLALSP